MNVETEAMAPAVVFAEPSLPETRWRWLAIAPLLICLLLALVVRAWLVVRTQGFIEGDEVLTGIQAQQILHGARPIYFYGQPYMGSLEAYLIALLFAVSGSSVWVLRAEPVLLSLILVGLTWKFALVLADEAHLSPRLKRYFASAAALLAAVPPFYDVLPELHTWGGYIETFIFILLLLTCALRLTRRWREGAGQKEMAWRWIGIGFVVGFAFWVYPLILPTVATVVCWILIFCAVLLVKNYRRLTSDDQQRSLKTLLRPLAGLWLSPLSLPAALLGFTPGLIWGFQNNWTNITYILNSGGGIFQRLGVVKQVTKAYVKCVVPRVIDGAIPVNDTSPFLHKLLLLGGIACIVGALLLFLGALLWRQQLLTQFGKLTSLALLFGLWTSLSFVTSKNSVPAITPCQLDHSGRYAVPLALVLPFIYAALVVFAVQLVRDFFAHKTTLAAFNSLKPEQVKRLALALQVLLLLTPLGYAGAQLLTYHRANIPYAFESPYCHYAPIDDSSIIRYLESQHVRYAWSTNWIAYRIVFETNNQIVVTDAMALLPPYIDYDRIPSNTQAVIHADKPALLIFVASNDRKPALLSQLDSMGVTYRYARFPAMSGSDVLIVIPQNRTVSPLESSTIGSNFTNCGY